MTIKQAIEALERIANTPITKGWTAQNDDDLRFALTALRSLPGVATEEEMTLALRDRVDSCVKAWERKVFRAGEQFARRHIIGE